MLTGKILGVNLKVHYLFLIWLVVLGTFGQLPYAMILFASVIFHELGHILAAANVGISVAEVELMPFGGVAQFNKMMGSDPGKEAAIALAGPANSLVLLVLGLLFSHYPWGMMLMESNVLLLLVNLLPVLPLDGGRVLRSFLVRREGVRAGSKHLLRCTVYGAVVLLALCGVLAYLKVFSINAVILACFVLYSARQERRMLPYMAMNHFSHLSGSLTRTTVMPVRVLAVQEATPLKTALESLIPDHYHVFMIIDPAGRQRTVTEEIFLNTLSSNGYEKTFGDVV